MPPETVDVGLPKGVLVTAFVAVVACEAKGVLDVWAPKGPEALCWANSGAADGVCGEAKTLLLPAVVVLAPKMLLVLG